MEARWNSAADKWRRWKGQLLLLSSVSALFVFLLIITNYSFDYAAALKITDNVEMICILPFTYKGFAVPLIIITNNLAVSARSTTQMSAMYLNVNVLSVF